MKPAACALMLILLAVAPLGADEPRGSNEIMARFSDGTVIQRAVVSDDLVLVTRFGKLSIPFKEIRRVDVGRRVSPESAARVEAALARLGSTDFKLREAASKELIELGVAAHAAVLKAADNEDLEIAKRARGILKEIGERVPEKDLNRKTEDVVHTRDSAIAGRIETTTIKARTQLLGELQFRVADLQSLHSQAGSGQTTVLLDTAKADADGWLDTGIVVRAQLGLRIDAAMILDGQEQVSAMLIRIDGKSLTEGAVVSYEGWPDVDGKLKLKLALPNNGAPSLSYRVRIAQAPELPPRPPTPVSTSTSAYYAPLATPPPLGPINANPPPPVPVR